MTAQGIGQPWVGNELNQVSRAGIPFQLHAMRKPDDVHFVSDWAKELNRNTKVLYPLPALGILQSLIAAPALFGRRFFAALLNALFASRESVRGRFAALAHLFVACHWARNLRHEEISHIHAQWAFSSGTIGMYGAWLLDKPFSFTGHATDLFRDRVALKDKIRRANFIICISTFHRDFYLQNGAKPEQLSIAYCGIDPSLFSVRSRTPKPQEPYHILSSGRLVEKKGFEYLIAACERLRERNFNFHCTIAGSGELDEQLRAVVKKTELESRVTITGKALKQEHIPDFMHSGDVYCLPCVWASDNDVDGLPQMLMEAMACGIPVISTRLVGIPDLVRHGETGLLVDPESTEQIADTIMRLAGHEEMAIHIRRAGRALIERQFDINTSLEPLLDRFRAQIELKLPDTDGNRSAPSGSVASQSNYATRVENMTTSWSHPPPGCSLDTDGTRER